MLEHIFLIVTLSTFELQRSVTIAYKKSEQYAYHLIFHKQAGAVDK